MIQLALYYNQREGKERIKKIKKILKNLLINRNKKLIIRVKIRKGKVKKNDEDGTDYRKVRNY